MRHFTKSTTFDVNYLFNGSKGERNNHKERNFNNEAMFDIDNLLEK